VNEELAQAALDKIRTLSARIASLESELAKARGERPAAGVRQAVGDALRRPGPVGTFDPLRGYTGKPSATAKAKAAREAAAETKLAERREAVRKTLRNER
jgi:hypothetical protein